ncbi:hypothetical protein ITP53_18140 [Nonomuraea sp. K274]|uniref:4-amino-4-deoxy-L-arabinose transferase-like glycosyltransferase n=1 Tax=Nonomuraea cypriaca TaxID=1187855 RepID=A0A931A7D6_9ACTN|nr:hypothetical protein [Nonomuraea cypriaca]MBF8187621.1 hypothetical protein [Nonomuraea cypriaca]
MALAPPESALAGPRVPSGRLGSGWVPAGVVCVGAVVVFLCCGVSVRDLTVFAAYIGIGVALPGTLLWRAFTGGGSSPAEDIAAGLALGYAVEVLAYLPARAAGVPLLVLVSPVAVIGTFACVPRLRRHWRGAVAGERMPVWCAWALAAVVGFLIAWSALALYGVPVTSAYVDMPYHLALVGEVRHHLPPTLPTVLGERLAYHWFVYAEMAATSWVTGIEPVTLVYRLSTLPMTAAMVVLVAVLGRRLGGRWWAGVASVGVTYLLVSPALRDGVEFTSRSMFTAWASPTQTFGALLFAPVVLLLVGGRRAWVVLGVLLAALIGAKATYLPLLLAGLLAVPAVRGVVERRLRAEWVVPAGLTAACLVVAHFVVFGQGAQGTAFAPFATMRTQWAGAGVALGVLTAVHLFCLACVWGGVAALGRRALDPPMLLLLGMGGAGVGAAVLLGHPSQSQLYFLEGVRPYLSVAAVCGVVSGPAGRRARWAVPACVAGAGAALLAEGFEVPGGPLTRVVVPYLVLGAGALLVWRRGFALVMVALLGGYAVPTSVREVIGRVVPADVVRVPSIPEGARAAGRWLRDHSSPGDVVATDLHCRPVRWPACDSRHFWVSGFSERRVLVEGWAYAESTLSRTELFGASYLMVPFADPGRLAANDAVFARPSAENVRHLAQKYGVKWLFTGINHRLDKFAQLRFRNATSSVYELSQT